jgi:2-dehydropantoate 2-reductase
LPTITLRQLTKTSSGARRNGAERQKSPARRTNLREIIRPRTGLIIWQKFVFLVALSAATTSMRQPIGPIRSNRQARDFLLDLT